MITTVERQGTGISMVDALWALYLSQSKKVREAFVKRLLAEHESAKTKAQERMVEESLTRAFDELRDGKVRKDARKLFM